MPTTISPSSDPTVEPTVVPTYGPSSSPTDDPTSDPSDVPTIDPTKAPSDNPTEITSNPTNDPTQAPTEMTINPTQQPTTDPTDVPIDSGISAYEARKQEYEPQLDNLTEFFQIILAAFAGSTFIMTIMAVIDAKTLRINDYFKIGAILSFFVQTSDMISDCFFVAQINIINKIERDSVYTVIFALSIVFIVFPAMTALFQLYFYAKKHWLQNNYVRSWLSKFSTLLLLLSVITGSSFAAVALLNSYIFQLDIFDMGLTQKQMKGFNTKRVYSIVIFEVPFSFSIMFLFILSCF